MDDRFIARREGTLSRYEGASAISAAKAAAAGGAAAGAAAAASGIENVLYQDLLSQLLLQPSHKILQFGAGRSSPPRSFDSFHSLNLLKVKKIAQIPEVQSLDVPNLSEFGVFDHPLSMSDALNVCVVSNYDELYALEIVSSTVFHAHQIAVGDSEYPFRHVAWRPYEADVLFTCSATAAGGGAAGQDSGMIRIQDATRNHGVRTLVVSVGPTVVLRPLFTATCWRNRTEFIAGRYNGELSMHDVRSSAPTTSWMNGGDGAAAGNPEVVCAVVEKNDDSKVAVSSMDNFVKVWDVRNLSNAIAVRRQSAGTMPSKILAWNPSVRNELAFVDDVNAIVKMSLSSSRVKLVVPKDNSVSQHAVPTVMVWNPHPVSSREEVFVAKAGQLCLYRDRVLISHGDAPRRDYNRTQQLLNDDRVCLAGDVATTAPVFFTALQDSERLVVWDTSRFVTTPRLSFAHSGLATTSASLIR